MQKPFIIHDPVYKTIILDEFEQILLNTRHVQRLRNIQQLGLVDHVYPGANHTRFEHSIGTMHMASVIGQALSLDEEDIRKIRIAGLLHDVGHPAFSHAVEDVLRRNPHLQPVIEDRKLIKHEAFSKDIIRNLPMDNYIAKSTESEFGTDPFIFFDEISKIATGDAQSISKPYLAQVIAGDIDADRIDFLLRDSYHTGVSFGLIDVDQIIESLVIKDGNILLGSSDSSDYGNEMALTAAESLLISRAHHYNAIIHNPKTQAARVMLLCALEDALEHFKNVSGTATVKKEIVRFFTEYNDNDLLSFIRSNASEKSLRLLNDLRDGRLYVPVARFSQKILRPTTRMALATIARHGVAKMKFESRLAQELGDVLVDLDVATGLPKSIRVLIGNEESFFYDESALANGLVRSISRQLSLTTFAHPDAIAGMDESVMSSRMNQIVDELSPRLLGFIRAEQYLPIEGIILLFYAIYNIFKKEENGFISIPRLRHITWLYRTILQFSDHDLLRNFFDYKFHERYGFPYSDQVFENIQVLVAMGMVDEDLRYYEKNGRYRQRYEYVLTPEGAEYAHKIAGSYTSEFRHILNYVLINKHSIPKDIVTMPLARYKTHHK
jgi:HD superfamily phosphohydrolase